MSAPGAATASVSNATCFTVTYVEVVPLSITEAASWLARYRDASGEDRGSVRFELLQRIERPNQFTILAAWHDPDAFAAHVASAHHQELTQRLAPLLAAPNDTRQHLGLAVAPAGVARGRSITAVTHVDVIPPHKDDGASALTQLAEASRKHAGNVRFEVWQQDNRPNHFTVVESWSSRRAFDAHAMEPQTRDFRSKLASMTGALYDERLYKPLV
jgi:quinol monooxygenase YgiN